MKIDLQQISLYDTKLVQIAMLLESHFGVEFKLTSGYRDGDSGVHGTVPCRGLDLSCPDPYFGKLIAEFLNSIYEYDADRPDYKVCLYHGEPLHIHLQVHPNTRLR
jgi:hypothetical protein